MIKHTPDQDAYRFKIFEKNLKEISEHNAKPDETYKMGVNQFTGLSKLEFKQSYLSSFTPAKNSERKVSTVPIKLDIDWVARGAVSAVKNQGSCASDYAFSVVGAIEGISAITFKHLTEYSAQNLIDCSHTYGNDGCERGNSYYSFNYIVAKGRYL